ncbi:polysaccharide pyruvyl transferase family protein [Butyrivibrio sp. INlla16]|uniref:polysaccharide pyruvyl transferase family protein n=1 Tax=Butyrivibrio sp. INlla16 TaxID=1520807 RepID=UPI00088B4502|nr:polysaccharide pyruvyl transferase family protein [Butyrivibrio sp. INlla16]SDB32182.1 Coenzyme F420-reducing hydrogenase, beta subunit [Butyrivibrio sp. INlla16]
MNKTIKNIPEEKCTGCAACYSSCPANAITMKYNSEGFLFPFLDDSMCINCGICLKRCPEKEVDKLLESLQEPINCKAAMVSDDAIRLKSSSGGLFSAISEYIISQNGYVCGAVYSDDYRTVMHVLSNNEHDLIRMRGSKYVQSSVGDCYIEIERVLKNGNKVLFSGCPCQVSGLKSFLHDEYENLYTVDIVCHGANSVFAYQSYIDEIAKGRQIESVNFRDKSLHGWSTPVTIRYTDGTMDDYPYHLSKWNDGFLNGIINRKCCATCHYAQKRRVGDITLGDFWQVQKWDESCNDGGGTSLVLINNSKGLYLYEHIVPLLKLSKEAPFEAAAKYNGQLNRPQKMAPGRKYFFKHLSSKGYHNSLWYGHEWRYDFGLVGWWFASNYGSVLTYFALGKILLDMDYLPILIRIPKKDGTPWEKITEKNIEFMAKHFYISKERTFDKMAETNVFCDGFLLGSDQLWVDWYKDLVGHIFYLAFADEKKKKIAYATSLGRSDFQTTDREKITISMLLRRFDAISVRETSGVNICKERFGIDTLRMLDPVFLCKKSHYDKAADESNLIFDEPYVFFYILDLTEEKKKMVHAIEKALMLKAVVLLDMRFEIIDDAIREELNIISNATIEDFISLIRNSAFIVTDSHHGACFGLIYEKQMITICNDRRGATRFESLFQLLKLEKCLIKENQLEQYDYQRDYQNIDYSEVNNILENEKVKALSWLKEKTIAKHDTSLTEEDVFSDYVWENEKRI